MGKQRNKNRKDPTLAEWMMMPTEQVLERFSSLPDAVRVGKGDRQFVYIPPSGTKGNKVLLVAHSDTVFDHHKREVYLDKKDQVYKSKKPGVGIGADDRAGIAILWNLRKSGHPMLIPNAEEDGCLGSRYLMSLDGWEDEINSHAFMMEFDRCNGTDLVFYDVGSPDLLKFLMENYKGYKKEYGSYTDIRVLCSKIAGVNISVGYRAQHSARETLNLAEWQRTLDFTRTMLALDNIPVFPKKTMEPTYSNGYGHGAYSYRRDAPTTNRSSRASHSTPKVLDLKQGQDTVVCPECEGIMELSEIRTNTNRCVHCAKEIL